MPGVDASILEKTGKELFHEILRVWKSADYEDYYKVGKWNDAQMKVDLQIMYAHRTQARASEPPPLDKVPMPEIREQAPQQVSGIAALMQRASAAASGLPAPGLSAPKLSGTAAVLASLQQKAYAPGEGTPDDPDDMQTGKPRMEKTGRALFRELLRLWDSVDHEDYYKRGAWNDELMRMDIGIVERHRKMSKSPEPPELEKVTMPEIQAFAASGAGKLAAMMAGKSAAGAAAKEVVDDMQEDKPRMEKTGRALFRELLRIWKSADYEDYYKAGKWSDEQMKIDIQIMEAHRKQAGAKEPMKLEEVKMPVIHEAEPPTTSPLAMLMAQKQGAVGAAPANKLASTAPPMTQMEKLMALRGGGTASVAATVAPPMTQMEKLMALRGGGTKRPVAAVAAVALSAKVARTTPLTMAEKLAQMRGGSQQGGASQHGGAAKPPPVSPAQRLAQIRAQAR